MSFSDVFRMDSDAERLARADYGYLITDIDVDEYVKRNASVTVLIGNIWYLIAKDRCSEGLARRISQAINTYGVCRCISVFDGFADDLRNDRPVADWLLEAVDRCGAARVIQALSFPKRFSPHGAKPSVDPIQTFRDMQTLLRARTYGAAGVTGNKQMDKDVKPKTRMYFEVTDAIKETIESLIGSEPDYSMIDELPNLSKGVSLYDNYRTSRSPAEKIHAFYHMREKGLKPNWRTRREKVTYSYAELTVEMQYDDVWKETTPNDGVWYIGLNDYQLNFDEVPVTLTRLGTVYLNPSYVYGSSNQVGYMRFVAEALTLDMTFAHVLTAYYATFNGQPLKQKAIIAEEGHVVLLMSVPKNWEKRRTITVERPVRMSEQLRLKRALEWALHRTWVGRLWLSLSDQTQNQLFAWFGSAYDEIASIDISSASDWIHVDLAHDCFPGGWFRAFSRTRPTHYVVQGKQQAPNRLWTLGTMGVGWTFLMESVFYLAVTLVAFDYAEAFGLYTPDNQVQHYPPRFKRLVKAARVVDRLPSGTRPFIRGFRFGLPYICTVYGDDCAMPKDVARVFIGLCDILGIRVNVGKSFLDGSFRESCGGDYYRDSRGLVTDATPIYWPRSPLSVIEYDSVSHSAVTTHDAIVRDWKHGETIESTELSQLVDLQHKLWDYSPSACEYLTRVIHDLFPNMTSHKAGTECADLWDVADFPCKGILDLETNEIRPFRDGDSYLLLTDPCDGSQVEVNRRELYLQPTTSWSNPYGSPTGTSTGTLTDTVQEWDLLRFLQYGTHYETDDIDNGIANAVPIIRPVNDLSLVNESEVAWVLKP